MSFYEGRMCKTNYRGLEAHIAREETNFDLRTALTEQAVPWNGLQHNVETQMEDPYFEKNTQFSPP